MQLHPGSRRVVQSVCRQVTGEGIEVAQGVFQASMMVKIYNEGPVTLLVDSKKAF